MTITTTTMTTMTTLILYTSQIVDHVYYHLNVKYHYTATHFLPLPTVSYVVSSIMKPRHLAHTKVLIVLVVTVLFIGWCKVRGARCKCRGAESNNFRLGEISTLTRPLLLYQQVPVPRDSYRYCTDARVCFENKHACLFSKQTRVFVFESS
jgi:hypothetical protein